MQDVAPPPVQIQPTEEVVPTAIVDNNAESLKSAPEESRMTDDTQLAAFEHRERAIRKAQLRLQEERARLKAEQDGFVEKAKANPMRVDVKLTKMASPILFPMRARAPDNVLGSPRVNSFETPYCLSHFGGGSQREETG
jgi:hypothetical protein